MHLPPPAPAGKCKCYRFASIRTFWFAQKEPQSLPPNTFHRLNIYLNAFAAWSLQRSLEDPQLDLKGLCGRKGSAVWKRKEGQGKKKEESEEKEGDDGEGKRSGDERGLALVPLCKNPCGRRLALLLASSLVNLIKCLFTVHSRSTKKQAKI